MKIRYSLVLFIPFILTSCTGNISWSMGMIIALFAAMLILFGIMFFIIFKKRKQADKSLAKFKNDLNISLQKFSTPEQKAGMLEKLIERIENDKEYQKDEDWKNRVLVCALQPLAAAYYKMKNESKALAVCSRMIELEPEHIMAHYNRGSIYSDMGLYDKAIADFDRTIELMPSYASTYNNRGLVYEKMEQYEQAIADYSKTIEMEDSPIAHFNRGNSYFTIGKKDKAKADYEEYLKLDPNDQIGLHNNVKRILKEIN